MQRTSEILQSKQNTSVALGFFDGLHIGHRKVIGSCVNEKKNGLFPICLTFAQSPRSVITKIASESIMTADDKEKTLSSLGIELELCPNFEKLKDISAEEFVVELLIKKLKAKSLTCGFNYHFGKGGVGDTKLLQKLCDKYSVKLSVISPEKIDNQIVSSTLIRSLIKDGKISLANKMLCSRFGFTSVIEHGKMLGRTIGTPTINQPLLSELVVPKFGVYASVVTLQNGEKYCGVTNIGVKPTVGVFNPLCETWMPDYCGQEIYGQKADIRLIDFLRAEKKFSSIDELKLAIKENAKSAKQIYNDINM